MNTAGLHHVTAIASSPQDNLDFYVGLLGLRLVKRTVNFDAPGTYHFYFGDRLGSPGTLLTFFPWPDSRRGSDGAGMTTATAFAVPRTSLDWWQERLQDAGVAVGGLENRFGEPVLPASDPDGLRVELIGVDPEVPRQPWREGPVPVERSLVGLHSVTLTENDLDPTAAVLIGRLGMRQGPRAGDRARFVAGEGLGAAVDVLVRPDAGAGRGAAGTVHHIAFRAADDGAQAVLRQQLAESGVGVSPVMDRTYFRSIYFREPGGVLFEVATDGPGFAVDEPEEALGERLSLPPWLEAERGSVEAGLPRLREPKQPGS